MKLKANHVNILEMDELNSKPGTAERRISELEDFLRKAPRIKQRHKEMKNTKKNVKKIRKLKARTFI